MYTICNFFHIPLVKSITFSNIPICQDIQNSVSIDINDIPVGNSTSDMYVSLLTMFHDMIRVMCHSLHKPVYLSFVG